MLSVVYVPFSCYTSHISVHKEVKIVHMVRSLPIMGKGAALVRRQICQLQIFHTLHFSDGRQKTEIIFTRGISLRKAEVDHSQIEVDV